jgi:hypothetical protein
MHTTRSPLTRRAGRPMLVATMLTLGACAGSTADVTSRERAAEQNCAIGTFDVTSIETSTLLGLEVDRRGIHGSGGSLQLRLRSNGTWRLSDDGSHEMRIVAGPFTAGFSADGWVEGRYQRSENAWSFTHTRASGAASLNLHTLGVTQLPLADMSPSVIPDGRASITCDSDLVTLESTPAAISISLERATTDLESSDQ